MTRLSFCLTLLAGVLSAQTAPLADGIYAVDSGPAGGPGRVVRQLDGKDVVLNTAGFAPLVLSGKPQLVRNSNGNALSVQLAPESAGKLETLTRAQSGQRIAIVIGDRILSAPLVRSVISDGKAMLTPCDDGTCTALQRRLSR